MRIYRYTLSARTVDIAHLPLDCKGYPTGPVEWVSCGTGMGWAVRSVSVIDGLYFVGT